MAKKKISDRQDPLSFETSLTKLEQIVTRLESGELPLEKALSEFEQGIQLARQTRKRCNRQNNASKFCYKPMTMHH
ncbi:Exodeoxyribonuclease 7 small subunit [Arsenophonus endosymbiont of Aleurodicus floccissimus]|nr:Exodeoxyribonuclease 7 small subunit [Arsenophonus endosymbiont of Aleurodicus floccissimus]